MSTVIVLNGDEMGTGDPGLGAKLMGNFLRTLDTLDEKPDVIVFTNGAVRLLAAGAPTVEPLQALDAAGVELLACTTCIEFFALRERLAVGQVSNMREIATHLLRATKVITI